MKSIDTIRLRKCLGWLGMLLPIIVLVLCVIYGEAAPVDHIFPDSISATYYFDTTITPFMIILGSAGILLMCYRGYTKVDDIINTLTGIFAWCICLFPCSNPDLYAAGLIPNYVGTFHLPVFWSGWIHNISAIIFFCLLAYNCLFLFTKSSGEMTRNKKIRNIIYRICGIGMLLAIVVVCLVAFANIWSAIWWAEAFALFFFGIAYLTKADIYPWLFCDSAGRDEDTDNA